MTKRKIIKSIKHIPTKMNLIDNFDNLSISKFYITAEP